ncbi:MAG: DUF86 domain-containing protein [Methanoregula sp.]|nr:DUF86 domain-containing protein [Methanoregula sp.]
MERYTSRGKEAFERDELLYVWTVHHLQVLGEAARGISKESQQRYSKAPISPHGTNPPVTRSKNRSNPAPQTQSFFPMHL